MKEMDESVDVELRPRFPLFGGWKTKYFLGYNVPSYEYLYSKGMLYALKFFMNQGALHYHACISALLFTKKVGWGIIITNYNIQCASLGFLKLLYACLVGD